MRKDPWWHTTRTRRQALVLGALWTVLAAAQWLLLDPDASGWRRLVPVGFTLLAVVHLGSWFLRGRRDPGSPGRSEPPAG